MTMSPSLSRIGSARPDIHLYMPSARRSRYLMAKLSPVSRQRPNSFPTGAASSGWKIVSITVSRVVWSKTSRPRKSAMRLFTSVVVPSGVSRHKLLGTISTSNDSSAVRLRRSSSARLCSSMSIVCPNHALIKPRPSYDGLPDARNQRYSPSSRRRRCSLSKCAPVSRLCAQFAATLS
ncbi:hypothetical protein SAMN05216228_10236 [Rhizobium tibeticum]|uniref:Uncharacterized protein n=1 Tax=Rhizobium tibeticum TaxID=501024 RepID=A0A1H8S181_9HYPH|nr:hypothetical protein RTCCBAU85039_4617 [Rhizobium tibeticum]SEO72352.1 hypothetical protein SAMN05216228_10236 [Rhizobium tibeticum]